MNSEILDSLMINKERVAEYGVVRFTSDSKWGEFILKEDVIESEGWDAAMEQVVTFFLGQDSK